jgi:glycosyltransferase involved in cell wall biosynthesis
VLVGRGKVCIVHYNASQYLTRVDRSARALAREGWEVVLVAIKDDSTPEFEDRGEYLVKRVTLRARHLPGWPVVRVLRHVEAVARTFWQAYRERADVYNPRDAEPLLVSWLAARLRGARLVYDSDELCLDRNKPVTRKKWWRFAMFRYERFFCRRADAVITTDLGRAEIIARRYGIPLPVVVLNVPDIIERVEPDEEFRAAALKGASHLLIYQGVIIEHRGIPEMIEAMRSIEECALAIVGYGHRLEEYRELLAASGLEDRVTFFDAVPFERLMRFTAAADVGMIPLIAACLSYKYAAPNKLFEYLMVGLPVVVSDLPEMTRVVEQERVGALIADPTDPCSIAKAVNGLLAGDVSLTEMGERGRQAALTRYNWEIEHDRLLDAYRVLAT